MRLASLLVLLPFLLAANASEVAAQSWTSKLFETQNHDFGTVARGADAIYKFRVKNVFKQDMRLVSVRSSCGCTSPSLEGGKLATGDIGYVVAQFNTRTFKGVHSATLTVVIEWNDKGVTRNSEVQLRVHGNIRGDIVFQPGAVRFDSIDQGEGSKQTVRVSYAGRSDWRVIDVRSASPDLEVELTELPRTGGRAVYDLLVRLKDTAPPGYFKEQLILVSNDGQNPRIPLDVEARIIPDITVSPQPLVLGTIQAGQQVSKKVLVRGKSAFRIVAVDCDDGCLSFKVDDKPSARHIVEVVFDAKGDPGKVKMAVQIATDMEGKHQTTFTVYADVVSSGEGKTEENSSAPTADENSSIPTAVEPRETTVVISQSGD
jgi:hypothetical protein